MWWKDGNNFRDVIVKIKCSFRVFANHLLWKKGIKTFQDSLVDLFAIIQTKKGERKKIKYCFRLKAERILI